MELLEQELDNVIGYIMENYWLKGYEKKLLKEAQYGPDRIGAMCELLAELNINQDPMFDGFFSLVNLNC
ncbi:hypothetical protein [Methanobrevibacter sp.]|uniref:hypothetical protein n=1 Tax=Methanobrevibacter sp. TaxID=66852 RepID=UPI003890DA01